MSPGLKFWEPARRSGRDESATQRHGLAHLALSRKAPPLRTQRDSRLHRPLTLTPTNPLRQVRRCERRQVVPPSVLSRKANHRVRTPKGTHPDARHLHPAGRHDTCATTTTRHESPATAAPEFQTVRRTRPRQEEIRLEHGGVSPTQQRSQTCFCRLQCSISTFMSTLDACPCSIGPGRHDSYRRSDPPGG